MSDKSVESDLVFADDAVEVRRLSVSEMDNRCYLLTARVSGAQVLVDAADDASALLTWVHGHGGGGLDAVLTTHAHWDHTRALDEVVSATGALTVAGAEDVTAIAAERGVRVARAVSDGEVLAFGADGALTLTCVGLRGHTPGSIAYVLVRPSATLIFSGDSLFPGGVGNTDHDERRFASLLDDVTTRLFEVYPDAARVLPGHGESTTLGDERPALGQWRERGW